MAIRVLFDEWGFQEPHGGVSRFFSEVMKNLPEGFEYKLTALCTSNEYLKAAPFNLPAAKMTFRDFVRDWLHGHYFPGANHVYRVLAVLFPWWFPASEVRNRAVRIRELKKGDYDVYHAAAWDLKCIAGKKPFIATYCDLIPEIIYHDRKSIDHGRWLAKHATHFLAISHHTKADLMRLFGISEDKISVVYLGYNKTELVSANGADALTRWGLAKNKYILYVGKRSGYKNFDWMIGALAPIISNRDTGIKLFCTGMPFSVDEKMLFQSLGIEDRIVQSFVTDEEMRVLFENAIAFIYPSVYEGFGIPILDAFAAGCPALIANASCFPEVASDAALYFDPKGPGADLRAHILELTNPESPLRQEMMRRGGERVKLFSWKKCAADIAEVYRRVYDDWQKSISKCGEKSHER